MSLSINILTISILAIGFSITACSNQMGGKSQADKSMAGSLSTQKTNSAMTDSLTADKNRLTKIYTQAIAEFIRAAYKTDKTAYDTLYFGKHIYGQPDDFPDIELPRVIEKTQIRLVTPEVGQNKMTKQKSLVYVNMMGWVDNEKAEFILVVFTNGGEHQYDYFINYNARTSADIFELDKIEFENFRHLNGKKSKRTTIYENGKYVVKK